MIRKKKFKDRDSVLFLRLDKLMVTSVGDTIEQGPPEPRALRPNRARPCCYKVLSAYPPTCLYVATGVSELQQRTELGVTRTVTSEGPTTLPRKPFPRQSISVLNYCSTGIRPRT